MYRGINLPISLAEYLKDAKIIDNYQMIHGESSLYTPTNIATVNRSSKLYVKGCMHNL